MTSLYSFHKDNHEAAELGVTRLPGKRRLIFRCTTHIIPTPAAQQEENLNLQGVRGITLAIVGYFHHGLDYRIERLYRASLSRRKDSSKEEVP